MSLAFGGYLFTGGAVLGVGMALDRWRNVLSDPLSGAAELVTDTYAVFQTPLASASAPSVSIAS